LHKQPGPLIWAQKPHARSRENPINCRVLCVSTLFRVIRGVPNSRDTCWHPGCKDCSVLRDLQEIARYSGRIEVKAVAIKTLIASLILTFLITGAAFAQRQNLEFHWKPSPVFEDDGIVRPEAVSYEVWLKRGNELENMVATVGDTIYMLDVEPGITQRLRVRGIDKNGNKSEMSEWSDPLFVDSDGTVVTVPGGAQLKSNYPNPFNPETRIVYGIPENIQTTDVVRLEIFSVQGYRVRTLHANRSPGWHEVAWDGKDDRGVVTSAGMYVTRLMVGDSVKTGKMTMVK